MLNTVRTLRGGCELLLRASLVAPPQLQSARGYAAAGSKVVTAKDDSDFDAQLKSHAGLSVVDFFAEWCGPCKMIAPLMDQWSQKYEDVKFIKVDVDSEKMGGTVRANSIAAMPTFVLFKGGRKVDTLTGADPRALLKLIEKHGKD